MMKRVVIVFLLFLLFCLAPFSSAEEAVKKYPPYPDVWGIELRSSDLDPESYDYTMIIEDVFSTPDGDYLIWYRSKKYNNRFEHTGIFFFSGKKVNTIPAEAKKINFPKTIKLNNETHIRVGDLCIDFDLNPQNCYSYLYPIFYLEQYIKSINIKGDKPIRKYLVYLRKKPFKVQSPPYCEEGDYCYTKFDYVTPKLISLHDDSFIITGGNFVIRVTKGFKTKFINKNIMFIDMDKIGDYDKKTKRLKK